MRWQNYSIRIHLHAIRLEKSASMCANVVIICDDLVSQANRDFLRLTRTHGVYTYTIYAQIIYCDFALSVGNMGIFDWCMLMFGWCYIVVVVVWVWVLGDWWMRILHTETPSNWMYKFEYLMCMRSEFATNEFKISAEFSAILYHKHLVIFVLISSPSFWSQ